MTARLVSASLALLLALVLGSEALAQSIDVKLLHFGVGDLARGGGPLAVQVQFTSNLDRPTEIEAVWEVPSADLDIAEHARRLVLNPGQAQRRWLYAEIPPWQEGTLQTAIFDLRLYEVAGGERVRDLGTVKLAPSIAANPPRILGLSDDAILVVGSRVAGLDIFEQRGPAGTIPSMHTTTLLAKISDAEAFPDRWEGLAQFDTIAWIDGAITPARLSEEAAQAIIAWTERGGNFIIAMPGAGDPWSVGASARHHFSDLLPSVAPTRIDDVPLREILPMLSLNDTLRDATTKTRLAVFDERALDRGWRPFVATPATKAADGTLAADLGPYDGKLVGIRREFGFGHITLLGIDIEELSSRALQVPALPQGDVFWNRLLGRRADTPSGSEYTALEKAQRLEAKGGYTRDIGDGTVVLESIGLSGQAAVGVLAATAVFGLYWLVAGPLGFAALKAMKRERLAWLVYVCVAAAFTGGILFLGRGLAGRTPHASHLTVLDMVERAPGESDITQSQRRRATSWVSVFAPRYGEIELALDPTSEAMTRNTLSSWRPSGSSPEGFPSRERYQVPLDRPNRARVPSRATTVDFKAQWLGALREGWGSMPRVQTPIAVRLGLDASTPTITLTGSLTHDLPGPLTDVTVIHIWPKQNPLQALALAEAGATPVRRYVGQLPNRGAMFHAGAWKAGESLDLARVFGPPLPLSNRTGLEKTIDEKYSKTIQQQASTTYGIATSEINLVDSLTMQSIFGMLTPPRYLTNSSLNGGPLRLPRLSGRELDLSTWWSQPCVIVMGWLEAAPLPFDMTLDEQPLQSSGRILVRWVIPLPAESYWIVPEKFPRATRDLG